MKKLSPKSSLNNADLDNNGIITDEEISKHERMIKIENDDKREDQIRLMAWFSLWGMLLYPSGIFFCDLLGLDTAANLLSDIAPTYFVAIAGLVAAFFGAQAYAKSKEKW